MPTNTNGGTTTSFSNTPQAGDDVFTGLNEDFSGIVCLNVMGNDLGGNAKILWSLDDGTSAGVGAWPRCMAGCSVSLPMRPMT